MRTSPAAVRPIVSITTFLAAPDRKQAGHTASGTTTAERTVSPRARPASHPPRYPAPPLSVIRKSPRQPDEERRTTPIVRSCRSCCLAAVPSRRGRRAISPPSASAPQIAPRRPPVRVRLAPLRGSPVVTGVLTGPAPSIAATEDPEARIWIVIVEDARGACAPVGARLAAFQPDTWIGLDVSHVVGITSSLEPRSKTRRPRGVRVGHC
jgi:hypothetical protein